MVQGPKSHGWEQQDGGLFFVVRYEAGFYMIEAAKFSSYMEHTTPVPFARAQAETVKRRLY